MVVQHKKLTGMAKAIHICNETCPVKHQCTTYTALADMQITGGITGIWAGHSYREQWRSVKTRERHEP